MTHTAQRGSVVRVSDVRLHHKATPASVPPDPSLAFPQGAGKFPFVRDRLMDTIEDLPPGAALPPERQLAEQLGVARMTLRRVLESLVREGLVVRKHGSGTFVAERPTAQPLTMTSFSEHMRSVGLAPSSRTLSFASQLAGARLGRKLKVTPSEPILRIVRIRLANEEPVAIESLHVPESLVPGLSGEDLEHESFYALLKGRFGVRVRDAIQTIEATVTTAEESDLLGVPLHSPAFLFEVTAFDASGRGVEFVRSIFRGDRYKITAEIGDLVPMRPGSAQSRGSRTGPRQRASVKEPVT